MKSAIIATVIALGAASLLPARNTVQPGSSAPARNDSRGNWPQQMYDRYAPTVLELGCNLGKGAVAFGTGFHAEVAAQSRGATKVQVVLTNYHVVQGCREVEARTSTGRVYTLTGVIVFDRNQDFAALSILAPGLPAVPLGDSGKARVGDEVMSIGNPVRQPRSLGVGLITGLRRFGERALLQTNVDVSHGSSGSPLIDRAGEAIGIIVGTLEDSQHVNYAVPVNYVREALRTGASGQYTLSDLAGLEQREEAAAYFTIGASFGAVRAAMESDSEAAIAARLKELRKVLSSFEADDEVLKRLARLEIAIRLGGVPPEERRKHLGAIAGVLYDAAAQAGEHAVVNLKAGAWLEGLALCRPDGLRPMLRQAAYFAAWYAKSGAPDGILEYLNYLAAAARKDSLRAEDVLRISQVADVLLEAMGIEGLE